MFMFLLVQLITAGEALRHPWFSEVPLPKSKDFMPTFPAHNDKDRYNDIPIPRPYYKVQQCLIEQ
jgi:cell division cycle 2-like